MKYHSLVDLFYQDRDNDRFTKYEAVAEQRRLADSAYRTGIRTEHGELFLAVPRELSLLSESVLRHERRISKLSMMLPGIAYSSLVRDLIINEVVSTNELESVHSSRREVHDALEDAREGRRGRKMKRFEEFVNLYFNLTEPDHLVPRTPQDVREIYDLVMQGEELGKNAPDGELFRKTGVTVYRDASNAVHEGLQPEGRIIDAIDRMLALVNSDEIPQVYSAILGHFIFEYIHPFYDGNGRTGRYLLALWLSEPLSILTTLSLSRVIYENKGAYYKAFKEAERPYMYGELTFFVIQMLQFVRLAQDELEKNLVERRILLDEAQDSLDDIVSEFSLSDQESGILYMLVQDYLFSTLSELKLREIASSIRCSEQTTRKYTLMLEEKGLLDVMGRNPLKFVLSQRAAELFGFAS